jgi:hypothetical protein
VSYTTLGHAVDAYLTILRGVEQANTRHMYGRILRAMATEFGSDTAPDDTASDRLGCVIICLRP